MNTGRKMIVTGHAQGEITEKKSRFIANVYEIHTEEQALEILDTLRRKYYDARHNCFAYVLGPDNQTQRFSDDKEPQGTAGKPILEVLIKQNYRNTLIVVTRYFGGILLGTGGLVRAYTDAALKGLHQAEETGCAAALFEASPMEIVCDYGQFGKLQYLISQKNIPTQEILYDAEVTCRLAVPTDQAENFLARVTELTNASAAVTVFPPASYILSGTIPVRCEL